MLCYPLLICPTAVDRHYLTPLFDPKSVVVFAGDPAAEPPCREAAVLRKALADGQFKGVVNWRNHVPTWR
jgi:acetyltransferase